MIHLSISNRKLCEPVTFDPQQSIIVPLDNLIATGSNRSSQTVPMLHPSLFNEPLSQSLEQENNNEEEKELLGVAAQSSADDSNVSDSMKGNDPIKDDSERSLSTASGLNDISTDHHFKRHVLYDDDSDSEISIRHTRCFKTHRSKRPKLPWSSDSESNDNTMNPSTSEQSSNNSMTAYDYHTEDSSTSDHMPHFHYKNLPTKITFYSSTLNLQQKQEIQESKKRENSQIHCMIDHTGNHGSQNVDKSNNDNIVQYSQFVEENHSQNCNSNNLLNTKSTPFVNHDNNSFGDNISQVTVEARTCLSFQRQDGDTSGSESDSRPPDDEVSNREPRNVMCRDTKDDVLFDSPLF